MIYLDNAATTLKKPDEVIEAVVHAMKTQGNASRGAHSATLSAARTIYDARDKISKFFNLGNPSNVIFTSNSTEALNIAINGIIKNGDSVVSTETEHNSVLRPLYHLEKSRNIDLKFVKADELGNLKIGDFEKCIDKNTKVVVVNHISNLTGNVLNIKKISKLAHSVGAILIVDGSQSAGTRKVDVKDLDIDVFCFTGHKGLYGPQGTGGMLIKDGIEIEAFKRGGSGVKTYEKDQPLDYPTRLEAGTLNSHGIAGLSATIDFLNEVGVNNIEKKEYELTKYFVESIKNINNVRIYGDFSYIDDNVQFDSDDCMVKNSHAAIVSINIGDVDSGKVADILSENYGIATRPGAHCAPLLHIALGTYRQGAVRFSFSYFTTKEELDIAINAIKELAE